MKNDSPLYKSTGDLAALSGEKKSSLSDKNYYTLDKNNFKTQSSSLKNHYSSTQNLHQIYKQDSKTHQIKFENLKFNKNIKLL